MKKAPDQKLADGIYPEHMTYLKSASLCGQADRIEVINGKVNIYDYKTNKEIYTSMKFLTQILLNRANQCCGAEHFLVGSGSVDTISKSRT